MEFKSLYQFLSVRLIHHLAFWILFVLTGSFIFSYHQNFPYSFFLLNLLVHLPVFVLFTYGVIYFLVPVFLLNRRYWQFFLSFIAAAGIAVCLRILVGRYVYYALFIPEVLHPKEWFNTDIFFLNLIWILGPAILFAMFKYYKNWMDFRNLANEAERKRLASELQVLKAQLNPHFLFNTFNNLYLLALQKNDKTPAAIAKMSDIFHYILYECNAIEIPVSKEIKLIENYIELEQLRYSDRLTISFEKNVDNPDCMIPPMMLYTFIENCFKHGSGPDPESPWIRLLIRVRSNIFEFEASNSISKSICLDNEIEESVGLKNVKRRLELIYPKNHELVIRNENRVFFVRLLIHKNCTQTHSSNA